MKSKGIIAVVLEGDSYSLECYKTLRQLHTIAKNTGCLFDVFLRKDVYHSISNSKKLEAKFSTIRILTDPKQKYSHILFLDIDGIPSEEFIAGAISKINEGTEIVLPEFLVDTNNISTIIRQVKLDDISCLTLINTNYYANSAAFSSKVISLRDLISDGNKTYRQVLFDTLLHKKDVCILSETVYMLRHYPTAETQPFIEISNDDTARFLAERKKDNEPATINTDIIRRSGLKFKIVRSVGRHIIVNEFLRTQLHSYRTVSKLVKGRLNKQNNLEAEGKKCDEEASYSLNRVRAQIASINNIEPLIIPVELYQIHTKSPSVPELTYGYLRVKQLTDKIDIQHLVLAPHLVRGGADLTAINLVKYLAKNTTKSILVGATVPVESPWKNNIDVIENAIFIGLQEDMSDIQLTQEDLSIIYTQLIIEKSIKDLSIINSQVGYMIAEHHRYLIGDTKIYLHAYAYDMTDEGYIYNVIRNGLVDSYSGVDLFVTDSMYFKNQLIEINGFDSDKIRVLYQPTSTKITKKVKYTRANKILWASRVSDAKLVNTLIEIARIVGEKGIEIHVYGALDGNYKNGIFEKMIEGIPTLVYHGSYDGFGSININDYDAFLLTTKNEGMPNVILEACMTGLFIIAPAVGGIGESVKEGATAKLVEFDSRYDASKYVDAIDVMYKESKYTDMENLYRHAKDISEKHSQQDYESICSMIYR